MIEAKHKSWARILFKKYISTQFKKNFHSFKLIGEKPIVLDKPTLLLTNHSSWWDGFFTYFWNEELFQKKYHVMMLQHQLKKYYFFQYLGAFSIKQESPKAVINSIKYTSSLLESNNNLVNIFPEGEMNYSFQNSVNYKKGIIKIIDSSVEDIQIIQLGMKIHHLFEEKPEVFFTFEDVNVNNLSHEKLADQMNTMLDRIDENIVNARIVFRGKQSK